MSAFTLFPTRLSSFFSKFELGSQLFANSFIQQENSKNLVLSAPFVRASLYGVSRNFEFWQKFLPLLLPTEHFPKKCRKMLKNAFFQNCQKSIVFAYFHSKLVLKGVFCSKLWISIT